MYPGINGKTHGDKKLIKPAPNATKISNINIYLEYPIIIYKDELCVFVCRVYRYLKQLLPLLLNI